MRCNNCGWENEPGKLKCEKCNAPLSGSMVGSHERSVAKDSRVSEAGLKKTLPERQVFNSMNDAAAHGACPRPSNCPQCGYPVSHGMNNCPNFGASVQGKPADVPPVQKPAAPRQMHYCGKCGTAIAAGSKFCPVCGAPQQAGAPSSGTVNPWATPRFGAGCTLKPLPWENERADYPPLSFSGAVIPLNRANTDPNNRTITSKEQAELSFENGAWYICDKSAQQTTYVHAGRKTKLEKGDVIILGNRRFEFNA